MTLTSALSIATSGLKTAQARAQNVASNIANANNENYTRRITTTDAIRFPDGQIGGVQILVEGATAPFLTTTRFSLSTDQAYATEKSITASELATAIGEPGIDDGLFRAYTRFETALRDASATPESTILQRQVVDRARELTGTIQSLSNFVDTRRTETDRRIEDGVTTVNSALDRLAQLNAVPAGALTPEIQDERRELIGVINDWIPVTAQPTETGSIQLAAQGGVMLLLESGRTIEFDRTGFVGQPQVLGAPLSGLVVDGVDITPGTIQGPTTGRFAALFEARDTDLPAFQDSIDGLAADLINRFAEDTADPTKAPGESGLFTDGTTTPPGSTNVAGTAARLTLNAAVDPAQGGELFRIRDGVGAAVEGPAANGDQLNRLIDAFTAPRQAPDALDNPAQRGAVQFAADVAAAVSQINSSAADQKTFADARFSTAQQAELSALGVDTDAELQQLLLIEQAFAANSRVIQTIDEMFAELLRL